MTTRVNPRLLALQRMSVAQQYEDELAREAAGDVAPVGAAVAAPAFRPLAAPPLRNEAEATPGFGDALSAAEEEDSQRRMALGFSRAGERIGAAFAGVRPDYSTEEMLAQQPGAVAGLMERRKREAAEADAARVARLSDPNSPESQRFRQTLGRVLPTVFTPEALEGVTAADEERMFRFGGVRADEIARGLSRKESAERYADARAERALDRDLESRRFWAQLAESRAARADAASQRDALRIEGQQLKQDERAERQQKDLGTSFADSGAAGFYSKYDEATAIMSKYKDDLPGFGPLAGRVPDAATSDDGVKLRQAIGQMLAEYRKGITGAGMSNTEREEYARITGLVESGTEERVRLGVEALKQAMDARAQAMAGGYRQDVVEEYGKRVPAFKRAMSTQPQASPARVPTPASTQSPGQPDINLDAPPVVVMPDGKRWRSNGDGTYSPEG